MFSLKDGLNLIIDRFRAIFNTETEETREYIAVYEFTIGEKELFEHLLKAVAAYNAGSIWDDREWKLEETKRNVLIELLIKVAESYDYEVVYGTDFKNIQVREKKV